MTKGIVGIICGLMGAAIGSLSTYVVMRRKMVKLVDELNEEKELGQEYWAKYKRSSDDSKGEAKPEGKPEAPKDDAKITEEEQKVLYNMMYGDQHEDDEEDPITEAERQTDELLAEYKRLHEENKNKPSEYFWAESDIADLPGYMSRETLFYYVDEDILVDDYDNKIEDYRKVVDDLLVDSGYIENEDEVYIFVVNWSLDTVYEIQKISGRWVDTNG